MSTRRIGKVFNVGQRPILRVLKEHNLPCSREGRESYLREKGAIKCHRIKVCEECGVEYSGRGSAEHFCSRTCTNKNWKKEIKKRYAIGDTTFGFKKGFVNKKKTRIEIGNKVSKALKGRTWDDKFGKNKADEMKKNLSEKNTGKKRPEHSAWMKKNNRVGEESVRRKISIDKIEKWKDPEYRKKQLSEENIQKRLKGLLKRPTSFEKKIISLCSKYRLPFVYTGDGRIFIGRKNPDFINEEKKIVIEVFLNYFKERDYGSVENYIEERGSYMKERGYDCIFIREEEVMDKNWENICLNKINNKLKCN